MYTIRVRRRVRGKDLIVRRKEVAIETEGEREGGRGGASDSVERALFGIPTVFAWIFRVRYSSRLACIFYACARVQLR